MKIEAKHVRKVVSRANSDDRIVRDSGGKIHVIPCEHLDGEVEILASYRQVLDEIEWQQATTEDFEAARIADGLNQLDAGVS